MAHPDYDPRNTPEIVAFRAVVRACFRAGESYRELKDTLATEDELDDIERRKQKEAASQSVNDTAS
jgi:hypothetical protein